MPDETIIWEGKPIYKPRFAILELFGGGWGVLGILLIVPFMSLLYYAGFCFFTEEITFGIISMLAFLGIILVPEYLKNQRRKNTFYQVSSEKVRFNLWWWWKKEFHEFDLMKVERFYYVEFQDQRGDIYLIMKSKPNFVTRNFWSGLSRDQLTFEDIPEVVEVSKLLNQALKDQE